MTFAQRLPDAPATCELRAGRLRAAVVPSIGGALAQLAWERAPGQWFDVLRPATAAALAAGSVRDCACFPMVPFASLVDRGRFSFGGKAYSLQINTPERDAALHGDAWQNPWQIESASTTSISLSYRQQGARFPFPYAARQDIAIEPDALTLALSVTNTGAESMPAGLGFHPFFVLGQDARLQFDAHAIWERDERGRVVGLRACGPDDSFARSTRIGGRIRNDVYEGWGGRAHIEWASAGVRAELHAPPPLSRLLVFVPRDRPVFCVEPVTNLPDAFNLLGSSRTDPGIAVLAPGESLQCSMRIDVSALER